MDAAKIVDLLAAFEEQATDAGHDRRQGPLLETRQRRHAELEGDIALLAPPVEQLDEQEVHDVLGGVVGVAHQVDGKGGALRGGPQGGEGEHPRLHPHHRDGKFADIGRLEAAQ